MSRSYLANFPQILIDRPDFVHRAVQFAGLAIIQSILAAIEHQNGISRHDGDNVEL